LLHLYLGYHEIFQRDVTPRILEYFACAFRSIAQRASLKSLTSNEIAIKKKKRERERERERGAMFLRNVSHGNDHRPENSAARLRSECPRKGRGGDVVPERGNSSVNFVDESGAGGSARSGSEGLYGPSLVLQSARALPGLLSAG